MNDQIVSFVGSHLDVVPANAEKGWDRDPFKLFIDGDDLYGRGTTDCLGKTHTLSSGSKLLIHMLCYFSETEL